MAKMEKIVDEEVEKQEISYISGWEVKLSSHFGKLSIS